MNWGHGEGYLPNDFLRITPLDRAGRRALWMRAPPLSEASPPLGDSWPDGSVIELRSGREGDDAEVTIRAGDVVTRETLVKLAEVLLRARTALEDE